MNIIVDKQEWINIETRNSFHGGTGVEIMKCALGYNHHGTRNKKINGNLYTNRRLRYKKVEDQKHIIQCAYISELKEEYLLELKRYLCKLKPDKKEKDLIKIIITDIRNYIFAMKVTCI